MAKNVIIYESHFELISELTNEQAGILIKAIGLFGLGQEPTITDPLVLGIWKGIRRDFVVQSENYQKKVETNRKNGLKGGRPKTQETQPVISETQHNPQNLKDKDKDKEKDKERDKDKDKVQVAVKANTQVRKKDLDRLQKEDKIEVFDSMFGKPSESERNLADLTLDMLVDNMGNQSSAEWNTALENFKDFGGWDGIQHYSTYNIPNYKSHLWFV